MSGVLLAAIVVGFVVIGVLVVRRTQRGAFVERLPLEDGERVLLDEEGLELYHRPRRRAVRGGGTLTYRVRSLLTDRRVLLATGGPEGKHTFVIQLILDYTSPAPDVSDTGYPAYLRKFGLANGYPTYACTAADVTVEEHGDETRLRVVVRFPEAGPRWGDPPEVWLATPHATRYVDAMSSAAGSVA